MEFEVIYIYNGLRKVYYITIDEVVNLIPKDIESSIVYHLKKHLNFCSSKDFLNIESIKKLIDSVFKKQKNNNNISIQ